MEFVQKPTCSVKAQRSDSTDLIAIDGINTASTATPNIAATIINKLTSIVGVTIRANEQMTRTKVEVAEDGD